MRGAVAAFLLVNVVVQAGLYRWRLDPVLTAVLDLGGQADLMRYSSMGFVLYGTSAIALSLLGLYLLASRSWFRRPAALIPLVGATAVTISVYVDTTVFKDHGVHFYEFDVIALLSNAWLARDLGIRPQDLLLAVAVATTTLVLEAALFVGLRWSARSRSWLERWSAVALVMCTGIGLGLHGGATPLVTDDRVELLESLPLRPILLLKERSRPHIDVVPRLGAGGYPVPDPRGVNPIPRVREPKNILFFVADGLRADHVTSELTPNLLAFGARHDVIAPARTLSTGHATEIGIFGLLYGLDGFHYHPFAEASVPPFPLEVLKASGYVTAFVSGSRLNKYPTDFMAESFDEVLYPADDDQIVPIVERFLAEREQDGRPYFLLLFFYTPHYPFDTVDPDNRRYQPSLIEEERPTFLSFDDPRFQSRARNSYKNSVIQADHYFELIFRLVQNDFELGRTALVATSDHGTEFWEHGLFGHGRSTFWKEKIEVPLFIGLGGNPVPYSSVRRPALASLKDVWPTLMDELRLSPSIGSSAWSDGLSLLTTPPPEIANRGDVFVAGRYFPWADRPNLVVSGGRKHWLRLSGTRDNYLRAEELRTTSLLDDPVAPSQLQPPAELAAALTRRFWRFLAPAQGATPLRFVRGESDTAYSGRSGSK